MISTRDKERRQLLTEMTGLRNEKMQREQSHEDLKVRMQVEVDRAQGEAQRLQAQITEENMRTQKVHKQNQELEGALASKR